MVVAVVALLMAVSAPMYLSYMRSSTLRGGAEELAAVLGSARQLAIKENTSVCVTSNGTSFQLHLSTCATAAWTGPGTDSAGWIRLANNVTVNGGNVVFDYIGKATTAGAYTVRNPTDGRTLSVVVALTGRVRITP